MANKQPPKVTHIPAPFTNNPPVKTEKTGFFNGLGGAGANGVFGIAQSLFNHHLADKSAQKQYDRQLEFWNMQNEYNKPSAQRRRMQDAGFNPASVAGEVATGQQAGELSSVPGNEYAQNGVLRLEGLAQTLEIMSRIEKLGAETGLLTTQMTTEALEQTLLGLGIDKAEVDYIIRQYEAQGKAMELENLPYFYQHTRNMYALEESYKSAQIEHENALKLLSDAHTEESKANAERLVAETGLIAIKAETEKTIQSLNYALSSKATAEKKYTNIKSRIESTLAPIKRRSLELANRLSLNELQMQQVEKAIKDFELKMAEVDYDANTNDETGEANFWYYSKDFLDSLGSAFGIALGGLAGRGVAGKSSKAGAGSGLYVPGNTKIGSDIWIKQ